LQGQAVGEVARALAVSEEAAKKRVGRAVEKLRKWFGRRGVAMSAAALVGGLGMSVKAAPVEVAAGLSARVLTAAAPGAAAGVSVSLAEGVMRMMLRQAVVKAGAWVAALGVGVALAVVVVPLAMGQEKGAAPLAVAGETGTGVFGEPATRPGVAGFGAAVEISLSDADLDPAHAFVDFVAGKRVVPPAELPDMERRAWIVEHVDGVSDLLPEDGAGMLVSPGGALVPLAGVEWGKVTPAAVEGALAKGEPGLVVNKMTVAKVVKGKGPALYAFATKGKRHGVVELMGVTGTALRVRFMVVEKGGAAG
jgi:hypothetical protein